MIGTKIIRETLNKNKENERVGSDIKPSFCIGLHFQYDNIPYASLQSNDEDDNYFHVDPLDAKEPLSPRKMA